MPGRPGAARAGADHQAGARHVGRLLHPADAEHVGPRPAGEVRGVARVLARRASTPASSIIRGGTHYDFSYIPNPAFGATLRGADLIAWYTTAWFDKYVKGDPTRRRAPAHRPLAPRRRRGRRRPRPATPTCSLLLPLAPGPRPRTASAFTCEDLRAGCPGLLADDGAPRGLLLPGDRDVARRAPAAGGGGPARGVRGGRGRPRRVGAATRARGMRFTVLAAHDRGGVPADAAEGA